jgi:hypothetical protein
MAASGIELLNLEHGLPTAAEARTRLLTEIDVARRKGVSVLKIVHGYGSSGRGGKLRTSLRTLLRQLRDEGKVGRVVAGEAWSIFDEDCRALLDRYPSLRKDADLERGNAGITFVALSRS